jgi:hypothetical protein
MQKHIFINIINLLSKIRKVLFSKNSFLKNSGWYASLINGYPCDKLANPIPWMNYSVINLLRERLPKDSVVFEFGSGYSTLFYSELALRVISVEHNQKWHEQLLSKIPANVSLIYQKLTTDDNYSKIVLKHKNIDLLVIDGRRRVDCAKNGVSMLSDQGILLLDDSDRERYKDIFDLMKKNGFRALDLYGLKPMSHRSTKTTIFYRDKNCINL